MKYRTQLAVLLGLLVLLVASTSAYSQAPAFPAPAGSAAAPSISTGFGNKILVDNAQVVSLHKVPISAQADGLISQLLADEGRAVKKADTLLIIDNRVAMADLEVAKTESEAAKKQAEQTAEVEYAKSASKVSDAEYEDAYELYQRNSGTYSEARRKKLEKDRARLGIEVAEVKHQQDILAAKVSEEKVKAAEVKLSLYEVVAPYDGVIVQRLHGAGEWIRSGEPILRLVHLNEMKVEAFVPIGDDDDRKKRKEGRGDPDNLIFSVAALQGAPMKVTVMIDEKDEASYETQVEFVSAEIESRSVRVSARIQNQQVGGAWLLRDGMVAKIEITVPN